MTSTDISVMISAIIIMILWISFYKYEEEQSRSIRKNKDDLKRDRIKKQQ